MDFSNPRNTVWRSLLVIAFLFSCVSEGDIGPEGRQGEKGKQGEAGNDGATVLNGNVNPTPEQGNIGDFYINTDSYVLFGPKTDTGWEDGRSVLGDKGDKGDKGEQGENDKITK